VSWLDDPTTLRAEIVADAAAVLGASGAWIKLQERQGKIPAIRRDRNGHRRFEENDLLRLRRLLYGNDELEAWARRQGLEDAEGVR
jgi:hypothetical protein